MPFFVNNYEPRIVFTVGDSKTAGDAWRGLLVGLLNETNATYSLHPTDFGVAGLTVATMKTYIDENLAGVAGTADLITLNLGANDVFGVQEEATWKANLTSIIDSLRAKWAGCKVYIAKAWVRDEAADCDTLAGWIDAVITTYSSGVYAGPDERVWLENGDDGTTYTVDGIHYSDPGQPECAAQWKAAMGY